mmetsp:Transcript_38800/g.98486  ORF Transcript_38800/g.98486 Transcript_38800/m.98486 type:complete len:240 (+) Transcript_38800:49-768(+)
MGAAASNATGLSHKGAHEVRVASTEILKVAGLSGFHTSIIVDDREFFFDREGIMSAPPLWSHLAGRAKRTEAARTEISDIGRSSMGGRALVQALQPFFEKGSYDIFFKNCNAFTDVALFFMTRQRLDCRFTRIERFIMATNPVSTSLLNRLFRAFIENNTGQAVEVDVYTTNPEAQVFNVDDVIAGIDASAESESSDSGEDDEDDLDESDCSDTERNFCCYRPRHGSAAREALMQHQVR